MNFNKELKCLNGDSVLIVFNELSCTNLKTNKPTILFEAYLNGNLVSYISKDKEDCFIKQHSALTLVNKTSAELIINGFISTLQQKGF